MRVLIGYASRFGSTRDIANRIANAIRTDGIEADIRSVDEISDFDSCADTQPFWHPRDYRVFAGVIDPDHWSAWGRLLFKALGGHAGDNRRRPDIDAGAEKIAQELRAAGITDTVRLIHHLTAGNENFRRG